MILYKMNEEAHGFEARGFGMGSTVLLDKVPAVADDLKD